MNNTHKNYLYDLGYELRDRALQAKDAAAKARGTKDEEFERGRAWAYYEVLSLMVMEAESFQLPIDDLHMDGLNPDRDLIGIG